MVTFTVFESVFFFFGVLPSINQTALSMIVKIGTYVLTMKRTVDAEFPMTLITVAPPSGSFFCAHGCISQTVCRIFTKFSKCIYVMLTTDDDDFRMILTTGMPLVAI